MELVTTTKSGLTGRERDYLIVTIFILAQHGHFDRARTLVEGMAALGDTSGEIILSRAVLSFFCDDFALTIECLDTLDDMEEQGAFNQSPDANRMRRYLRARCYFQTGKATEAQEIAAQLAEKPKKQTQYQK